MTYQEAIDFMYAQLPMFHRVGKAAYKADLGNTIVMDDALGNPHRNFKTIHVAGTNGKGSSSHILASILQEAGYRTGLYTSPHLKDFRERIRINGQMISEEAVIAFIENHQQLLEDVQPSFFEMTVSMAFEYFSKEKIDIAIIETGLGGRLDSTNIIQPLVSLITNIGLDHTDLLGNSLEKIAYEKAGIIKQNTPIIISERQAETQSIFIQKAQAENAPIYFAEDNFKAVKTDDQLNTYRIESNGITLQSSAILQLSGDYQSKNLCGVMQVVAELQKQGFSISEESILKGLAHVVDNTGLMGRWQILCHQPLTVCDTGHNEHGIKWVTEQIKRQSYNQLHIVIGMVNDKDPDKVLSLFPKNAIYYFTKAQMPRALEADKLKEIASNHELYGNTYSTVTEAKKAAESAAQSDDMIFIGGSTFIVAEIVSSKW